MNASKATPWVFTGSVETEQQIYLFLWYAKDKDSGVHRAVFKDDYMWKVMTDGRAGPGDAYEGSMALDDTGGFFEVRDDGLVYLTEKAKSCIK